MVQNEKEFCLSHPMSQESCIIWSWFMVLRGKIIISPGVVFIFSKCLVSGLLGGGGRGGGVKEQKIAENDKKFCLLHLISQEPYIIWSSFVVHKCEMVTSPSVFFIFQNFDFLDC